MTLTDPATTIDTGGWGGRHAHDPTAVRDDDGTYWLFSTDAYSQGPVRGGVQIRRSHDLVTWTFHGWALDGVPEAAARWTGAEGLWAPEVIRVGDTWRMYYSASTFGSRTSAIGLATAPAPAGPWTDRGLVVTSRHEVDGPNAIDANVVVDTAGRHWMIYGSFFGGIHALELDPATGFALDAPAPGAPTPGPGTLLARRHPSVEGAIEGAYALPRPGGGWAMVVSYDSLFSTYHVRVAVAEHVTGPYHDRLGHVLTDVETDPAAVGTTVLASHQLEGGPVWLAPGHAAVLTDAPGPGTPGRQLLVHHVRHGDDPTHHEVQARRLVWTSDGWPLISPQPWAGPHEQDDETQWPSSLDALVGGWELLGYDQPSSVVVTTRTRVLWPDDVAALRPLGRGRFSGVLDGVPTELVVFPAWDGVRGRATLALTALGADGTVTCGTLLP
ncbi:arabinan endo-1,5-alpha-L-arabinosidase [Cellulomonas soli]